MIGRSFKYKLLDADKARKVVSIDNGMVKFDDGGVIEETMLTELFEEVPTSPSATPIVENQNTTSTTPTEMIPDPNSFFNSSNIASKIINDAKSIDTNSIADIPSKTGAREIEKPQEQIIGASQPTDEQVKKVEALRPDFTDEDYKLAGMTPPNKQKTTAASSTNVPPQNPANSFLHQLKKNHKVTLNLEIDENIPKPDFIKMMDENFNNGVLDQLVTEIVDKYLRNPTILERAVKQKLEEIVYGKKKITTPKRRTSTPKKKTQSKAEKSPAVKKEAPKKEAQKNESKSTVDISAETAENK
jgi:hypothetical protein